MTKRTIPLLLAVAAAGSIAAGCGNDTKATPSAHAAATAKAPTETPAATLRANLTSLLQEHVYLAGIAVDTGVGKGLTSPAFKAAAATLDDNSVALSQAIGSVYGQAAGRKFLGLWRQHIGFFVSYTKGLATHDRKLAAQAQGELDGYRHTFAAFLHEANPNIDPTATADSLAEHVRTLSAAIRAVVAGSPKAYDRLRMAADHMPMTADYLAQAIARQKGLS